MCCSCHSTVSLAQSTLKMDVERTLTLNLLSLILKEKFRQLVFIAVH